MEVALSGTWRRLAIAIALAALGAATWLLFAPSGGGTGADTARAGQQPPYVLDHFLCYRGQFDPSAAVGADITLRDQFAEQAVAHRVGRPEWLCNPTRKEHPGVGSFPIVHPNNHLSLYRLNGRVPQKSLRVRNQFQTATATDPPNLVTDPGTPQRPKRPLILVPTRKAPHPRFADIDHFKCYPTLPTAVNQQVTVQDEFPAAGNITVLNTAYLCNPAAKKHGTRTFQVKHPRHHLVCYTITPFQFPTGQRPVRQLRNQFGQRQVTVIERRILCVPSRKSVAQ